MNELLRLLLHHGYLLLFGVVFAEQAGVPVPADPLMLAMGALAGTGHFSLAWSIAIALFGAMAGDILWYEFGYYGGHAAVRILCKFSLEPDSCVRRTQNIFAKRGPRALLFSKFIPGLSAVATPLAGMARIPWPQFLFWDGAGALLWVGVYIGAGFVFREQLEWLALGAVRVTGSLAGIVVLGLALYIGIKYWRRRRFMKGLRAARITPEALWEKLQAGEDVVIVDLRHSFEFEADPVKLPGALNIQPENLSERQNEIARDRELVLYCTCPNEATSASVAQKLHRQGFSQVRPLEGGIAAWRKLNLPVERVELPSVPSVDASQ
jgi:membrane protein DedA with SNARE-associated domain/rhodanese-related sulfurtransferase